MYRIEHQVDHQQVSEFGDMVFTEMWIPFCAHDFPDSFQDIESAERYLAERYEKHPELIADEPRGMFRIVEIKADPTFVPVPNDSYAGVMTLLGPQVKCPKCNSSPSEHEVRNHSLMWHDGDVYCTKCGAYVRAYDAG